LASPTFEAKDRRPAAKFGAGAREDGLARAAARFGVKSDMLSASEVADWASGLGVEEIVTAFAPTGPTAALLADIERRLKERHVSLVGLQRTFDARTWPHATAGFFKLKQKIPQLIVEAA
jgi:deoxyribodipyrimidine photo-lyase